MTTQQPSTAGSTVDISGGTVEASGATDAAGIGGGVNGAGGDVRIDAGAVVTARGGHTAIGAGTHGSSFGSLAVAGTLRLPAGNLRIPSGIEVAVVDGGQILGGTDPAVGANFLGNGRIVNHGVIALAAAHVFADEVSVSGHHFAVAFDAQGGTPALREVMVFSSTFQASHRDFPAAPTRGEGQFQGWTDQFSDPITATAHWPVPVRTPTPTEPDAPDDAEVPDIEILTPFSRGKQRAIRQLNYHASTKILFQVRERIWEQEDAICGGATVTDLPVRRLNYPATDPEMQRGILLASYTWGQDALQWGAMDPETRQQEALDDVERIHPRIREVYEVGDSYAWYGDKWARGAFALFSPEQQTQLHADIVRPEGRILFAGEHCSLYHAWIQGALESGIHAAEQIQMLP